MAPTSSNSEGNPQQQRPDRKEMVLLLWRDFGVEMFQLDMMDVEAKVAGMN